MDILVANSGAPGVQLFENTSSISNHFVAFHLEGVQSNRDAIGSRIEVYTKAGVQYDQVISNSGWAANNGRWIHFGLAAQELIDYIKIYWPSGVVQQIESLDADKKYFIREGEGVVTQTKSPIADVQSCTILSDEENIVCSFTDGMEIKSMQIFDITGRAFTPETSWSGNQVRINTGQIPAGLYQVTLQSNENRCASKIFIGGKKG
jgi:hypothetical protein